MIKLIRNTVVRKLLYALAGIFLLVLLDLWNVKKAAAWKASEFQRDLNESILDIKETASFYLKHMNDPAPGYLFTLQDFSRFYPDRGIIIQAFDGDSMVFWSGSRIAVKQNKYEKAGLYFIDNGWYYLVRSDSAECHVTGLAFIKNHFILKNDYLTNNFHSRFNLNPLVQVLPDRKKGTAEINDEKGQFICSLDFSQDTSLSHWLTFIEIILGIVVLWFMINGINTWIQILKNYSSRLAAVLSAAALLFIFKSLMVFCGFPRALYELELFSPVHFASSAFLHSLGDLLLVGLILLYAIYQLHQKVDFTGLVKDNKKALWFISFSFIIVYTLFFYFISVQMESLVVNSDISFEFQHITFITPLSFVALLTLAIYLACLVLLIDKHILIVSEKQSFYLVLSFSLALVILLSLAIIFIFKSNSIGELSILVLLVIIFIILNYFLKSLQSISKIYISIILLSAFSTYFIGSYMEIKAGNEKKVLAANLSSERDPIAEYILRDIDRQITQDEKIKSVIQSNKNMYSRLVELFRNQYFFGYWNNFDLQIALCGPGDSLIVKEDQSKCHCISFFDKLIDENGKRLDTTCFYYLDDHNGYVSYLGSFSYISGTKEYTLYIELDAKLNSAEIGYPALLLNTRQQELSKHDYSFAKYFKGQLMTQTGKYHYAFSSKIYPEIKSEFEAHSSDGHRHLYYKPDKDYLLIISNPQPGFREALTMFSYICVFYFILISCYLLVRIIIIKQKPFFSYYRNKILVAIIGISFMALITLGVVLIFFLSSQFKEKHNNLLREKINAIYDYLIGNSSFDEWTEKSARYYSADLEELLIQSSNLFYCDINLFALNGKLIATSRPEVYKKKLKGNIIQPQAFTRLSVRQSSEFVVNEYMGNMNYISAYTPILNNSNQSVCYLNVPYFSRQTELQDEISNVIITIVNISVLLIMLAVIAAFIISSTLTYPLQLIQMRFKKIRLSGANEKIEYNRKDELGRIINAYNNMVEELDKNIKLLARTERESAWREMAKQVAHEIKNPLTPMKLSIQQLQRAIAEGRENQGELISKLSGTLIEQIDNLSRIATEFSNFAKMPAAQNEKINIIDVLTNVKNLFSDKNIILNLPLKEIYVNADKEQLQRVFINLVTNAIQAVPDPRKELVEISVELKTEWVCVKIQDNGIGVDSEMRSKLFQPNFTTKSSGSGLGLSIVKNIVESAKGIISYSPNPSGGSVFIVEIPIFTV